MWSPLFHGNFVQTNEKVKLTYVGEKIVDIYKLLGVIASHFLARWSANYPYVVDTGASAKKRSYQITKRNQCYVMLCILPMFRSYNYNLMKNL